MTLCVRQRVKLTVSPDPRNLIHASRNLLTSRTMPRSVVWLACTQTFSSFSFLSPHPHPYSIALAVHKSPAFFFFKSRTLDWLWRENKGSVNRLLHDETKPEEYSRLEQTEFWNAKTESQVLRNQQYLYSAIERISRNNNLFLEKHNNNHSHVQRTHRPTALACTI